MWDRSQAHDTRHALFGGRGSVRVWNLCPRGALAPFTAVLACELEPGGSVGRHVQSEFPEIVVVTAGSGTAHVNGEAAALVPGSVVALPLGHTLALENGSSSEPLVYLIIKATG